MTAIYSWGTGTKGQLGNGILEDQFTPTLIKLPPGERPAQISNGGLFCLILTQKGDMFVCGYGKHGRLGLGDEGNRRIPERLIPGKDVKVSMVSSGSWHGCAVTLLGKLYTWGYNAKYNVLGRDTRTSSVPFQPGIVTALSFTKVELVSCGHNYTLVKTDQNQVYSWGCGRFGVLGHGSEDNVEYPRKIDNFNGIAIIGIAAGHAHSSAVTSDGRIYMFGRGADGALGFGDDMTNQLSPKWLCSNLIGQPIHMVSCSIGDYRSYTLALTEDGKVLAWGANEHGKLGLGDKRIRTLPTKLPDDSFLEDSIITQVSAGGSHSMALDTLGRIYTWGLGSDGKLGHKEGKHKTYTYFCLKPKLLEDIPNERKSIRISATYSHSSAICS